MYYSAYEISLMSKGHGDDMKRECRLYGIKNNGFNKRKLKKLISVILIVKNQSKLN